MAEQSGMRRASSAGPRNRLCLHQLVLQKSPCWVHRVAKLSRRWIWGAFRAKCFALCWMRWSLKRTLAPPNKARRVAEGARFRGSPRCSWTRPLVFSAETNSSRPPLMSRFGGFLMLTAQHSLWELSNHTCPFFRMHSELWKLQLEDRSREWGRRRHLPTLSTGTWRWLWPTAPAAMSQKWKQSLRAPSSQRQLRRR